MQHKPNTKSCRGWMPTAAAAGLALLLGTYATPAKADITLGDVGIQGNYSIVSTTSSNITAALDIVWYNTSDVMGASQISANGNFGSDDVGLSGYSTTDPTHTGRGIEAPTLNIQGNSFELQYADGVSNPADGGVDTFTLYCTYDTTDVNLVNAAIAEVTSILSGEMDIADAKYTIAKSINGEVTADGTFTENFENSPIVYLIDKSTVPEPATGTANGTPIAWLEGYGYTNDFEAADMADPDMDGFLNWQEYQADTNPTNGASYLSIGIFGTNLTFAASSNCMYAVEWSESLSSSNDWKTLTNDVVGINGQLSVSDPAGATNRFYRLNARLRTE